VLNRDPVHVVGSAASLVHNQMMVQSDAVDRSWIGQEWLRKVGLRQARVAEARQRHDVPAIDVAFSDMQADWRGEMGRVYRLLEMPLTAQAERGMAGFMRKRSHRKLRRHHYDIADYALTEDQIRRTMGGEGPVDVMAAA